MGLVLVGVRSSRAPAHRSAFPPALGIEELCQKREELCRQIQQEEDEKQRLQNEVRQLTEKLARVNENLARKIASRNEFDRTIAETEAAYLKVGLSAVRCHKELGLGPPPRLRGCRRDRGAACGIPGSELRCLGKSAWCGPELSQLGFAGRAGARVVSSPCGPLVSARARWRCPLSSVREAEAVGSSCQRNNDSLISPAPDPGELSDSAQCPQAGSWEPDQSHSLRPEE